MSSIGATGERIRTVRLASNTSQIDLANSLGSESNGLISKIENGRVQVDDEQLRRIADELDCTPEFLQRPLPDVLATRPWLRAYADAPARTVDSVTADNVLVHELINHLHLVRVADSIPQFPHDANLEDDSAIEAFALEVRAAADIAEDRPVGNAMRTAERLGCVMLPLADELGRHLGLSQRLDGVPYIRVSRARANVPGDRQRFTVLHEVGHLALHSAVRPPETAADARVIEQQAHLFAAAMLTPADPLLEHWQQLGGRVTLTVLQELKAHWGVAVKALVGRFKQLGVIDADQAVALYKQISKRGWNTGEPVPVSNEEPVWFQRALIRRFETSALDRVTLGMATAHHGLGASHVERWADWTPVGDESADTDSKKATSVVELQARRGRTGEAARRSTSDVGTVTTLRRRRKE